MTILIILFFINNISITLPNHNNEYLSDHFSYLTHSALLPLLFPHQLINICTAKGKVYYRCWRGQCKGPRLLSLKTPSCIVWN